jgi:hypothetical protein
VNENGGNLERKVNSKKSRSEIEENWEVKVYGQKLRTKINGGKRKSTEKWRNTEK